MVIPRSRSMSMLSSTWALPLISRSLRPPVAWISRSASVDLPWSICAMIEKLRMRSILVIWRRASRGLREARAWGILGAQPGEDQMNKYGLLAAGVSAAALGAGVYAAAPGAPPPVASYWMDVATTSGLGAGMSAQQMM